MNNDEKVKNEENLKNREQYTQDVQNHRLIIKSKLGARTPWLRGPLGLYHPGRVQPNLCDFPWRSAPIARFQEMESGHLEMLGPPLHLRRSKQPAAPRQLHPPAAPDSRPEMHQT